MVVHCLKVPGQLHSQVWCLSRDGSCPQQRISGSLDFPCGSLGLQWVFQQTRQKLHGFLMQPQSQIVSLLPYFNGQSSHKPVHIQRDLSLLSLERVSKNLLLCYKTSSLSLSSYRSAIWLSYHIIVIISKCYISVNIKSAKFWTKISTDFLF